MCEAPRAHEARVRVCLPLGSAHNLARVAQLLPTFESLMPDEPTVQPSSSRRRRPNPWLTGTRLASRPAGALAALRPWLSDVRPHGGRAVRPPSGRSIAIGRGAAEVERLLTLNAAIGSSRTCWPRWDHNRCHLHCGGLLNVMLAQANELFAMATRGWLENVGGCLGIVKRVERRRVAPLDDQMS